MSGLKRGVLGCLVAMGLGVSPALAAPIAYKVGSLTPFVELDGYIDLDLANETTSSALPTALRNLSFVGVGFAFFANDTDDRPFFCDGSVVPAAMCDGLAIPDPAPDYLPLALPLAAGESQIAVDMSGANPSWWVQVFVVLSDATGASLPGLAQSQRAALGCAVDGSCDATEITYLFEPATHVAEPASLLLLLAALGVARVWRCPRSDGRV